MRTRSRRFLIMLCAAVLLMGGCIAASRPTKFYVLSPGDYAQAPKARPCPEGGKAALRIMPVILPKSLDRPQIMTRIDENELHLSEFNEWAGPLQDNVSSVISRNLSTLTCMDIIPRPAERRERPDFLLSITVDRFDGAPGRDAVLDARWSVSEEGADKPLLTKQSVFTEHVGPESYDALVSAYSRLLASFSREIAGELESVEARGAASPKPTAGPGSRM